MPAHDKMQPKVKISKELEIMQRKIPIIEKSQAKAKTDLLPIWSLKIPKTNAKKPPKTMKMP